MLEYLATMETADDRTRFESLYLAYRGLMYHVAYHILKNPQDAEDAVHQSFVKLAEHMVTIPDGPCPRTRNLVVTVAERKAIDLYRSRQRHPETELDEQTVWSAPPGGRRSGRCHGIPAAPVPGGASAKILQRLFRPGDRGISLRHP